MNKSISIVIPALNEELIINKLLVDLEEAFSDVEEYEIIIIDDGSEKLLEPEINENFKNKKLRVLRNSYNVGQTASIKIGIENSKFDLLQKNEKDKGFQESINNARFFNKGKIGQWKNKLNTSQIQKIENDFRSEMEELGYL